MTVGTLFATATSRELMEWAAYFKIEAEEREIEKMAGTAAAKANSRKKR